MLSTQLLLWGGVLISVSFVDSVRKDVVDTHVTANDPCVQPKKSGPCRALFMRYYYNTLSCKCEQFIYGGCQPNGNNFETLDECESKCSRHMHNNDICENPKDAGECLAKMLRWYYNRKSCKCEQFIFGGCGGNSNNFRTELECKAYCRCYNCPVCNLPAMKADPTGPMCLAIIPRFFFNTTTCQCEVFDYSGCGGNGNNFVTEFACKDVCGDFDCPVCNLPIMTGGPLKFCRAHIQSYGFNTTSCQCERFIYGGCGGNANRFPTMDDCMRRCDNAECQSRVPCNIPRLIGPCRASIPRYFYNSRTCECEKFFWGGCQPNANNFETIETCRKKTCECFKTCENDEGNCNLPKDPGPCKALIPRFYYDAMNCKCTKFNYGGCQGNANNYKTKKACKKTCADSKCPVCNLPPDTGPCECRFKMYYYDIQTCQCESFTYGGCGGNGNRYKTRTECEAVCGSISCPVCNLPPKKGSGKNKTLNRWYFDAADCDCKQFAYGGSKGNLNRFFNKSDCEGSSGTYPCPVCSQTLKTGPCKGEFPRWYYNTSAHKCEKFTWGGCQPNGNNFLTKQSCKKVCKRFVCKLPLKIGPCEAAITRYYYDAKEGKCKTFLWGGCEPNGNNFESFKECNKYC